MAIDLTHLELRSVSNLIPFCFQKHGQDTWGLFFSTYQWYLNQMRRSSTMNTCHHTSETNILHTLPHILRTMLLFTKQDTKVSISSLFQKSMPKSFTLRKSNCRYRSNLPTDYQFFITDSSVHNSLCTVAWAGSMKLCQCSMFQHVDT